MQAVVYTQYGPPANMRLQEVAKPVPQADEVLIKIRAASVNRSDWESLLGKPAYARSGFVRPGKHILGSDIAGVVEAAGSQHTKFKPGDLVFGDILGHMGGFAEYVAVRGRVMAHKPAGLSFAQAAALPQAGVIALQAIRDKVKVGPGTRVLINGGGGGGGLFAIQLAKLRGAEVTAVDNAGKLDFMRALGADHVLDYRLTDYTRTGQQYDLIIDLLAYRSPFDYARALQPGGRFYAVGGSLRTFFSLLGASAWIQRTTGKHVRLLVVRPNADDLAAVANLCVAGQLRPLIDRTFPLSETPAALQYLGDGRAKGKIVVTMGDTQA